MWHVSRYSVATAQWAGTQQAPRLYQKSTRFGCWKFANLNTRTTDSGNNTVSQTASVPPQHGNKTDWDVYENKLCKQLCKQTKKQCWRIGHSTFRVSHCRCAAWQQKSFGQKMWRDAGSSAVSYNLQPEDTRDKISWNILVVWLWHRCFKSPS